MLARVVVFLLLLNSFQTQAQNTFTLLGRVIADDLKPLSGAIIYVAGFSSGLYSDSLGNFNVRLKPGINEVTVSYIGYRSESFQLYTIRDTSIEVKLHSNLDLNEVMIVDRKQTLQALHDANGTITITKQSWNTLPAFLGENDPMKAVQMQPGVQSGGEGSRGIFIRGGGPDQNLMQIDGATVYNPSHIYGFVSVFNGDAIQKVSVFKDHFPSRFGGRLCSVIDIEADEGNRKKLRASVTVGVVTSRVHIDGPIRSKKKKDKPAQTTYSLSGRVCYVGLLTQPISARMYEKSGYSGSIYYYFGDVNAKLVHRFNDKTRISFNFFTNNDFYSFERNRSTDQVDYASSEKLRNRVQWQNYVASMNFEHQWNKNWIVKQQLTFSRYNITQLYDESQKYESKLGYGSWFGKRDWSNSSFIHDYGYRGELIYETGPQTFFMGGGANFRSFRTGKGKGGGEASWGPYPTYETEGALDYSSDVYVFAEDQFHPHEHWLFSGGFHARLYTAADADLKATKTFFSLLPRVNMVYNPVAKFYMRASASGLSQNIHLLTTSNADILNDLWVPATAKAKPETSWNFSSGIMQKLPLAFEWSIDGFYRQMNNLIEYREGAQSASTGAPWEDQIITEGKGRSYGVEFYVARTRGRITGSAAYTLSWSERRFASLNGGQYYPFKYDRRHNFAAQLVVLVGKHVELGTAWIYGSGNMYTLPLQSYRTWWSDYYNDYNASNGYSGVTTESITVYSGKNGYRLPAYHHLDLSFTYRKKRKVVEHAFNVSIYNVYNRFNQFSIYRDSRTNADGTQTTVFKQLSLFPVLPSLSYTIKLV